VTLLERGQPGRAASWASAGIVGAPTGPQTEPGFQLQALSRRLWPGFARELAAESGLDPEYREMGCLIPALDDKQAAELERAIRFGMIPNGHVLQGAELREAEPSLGPAIVAAAWRPGGNVENRRLCRALEISIRQNGVDVRTGAEVRAIRASHDRVTGVELADGFLPAGTVVVAAGAWSGALPGCRPVVPVQPQRGQILALDRGPVVLNHVILTPDDPYLVPRADGRIVVGATRDFAGWDPSITAGGISWLLGAAIDVLPALSDCIIYEIWTGFRPISGDGTPIIGRGALDGLFFATGHGASGIGPLPGTVDLLAALVVGGDPPIPPELFSPLRFGQ
jgi:glycine oxidase